MNLEAGELRIAFTHHLIILLLRYPLPEASHSMNHSANKTTVNRMACGDCLGPSLMPRTQTFSELPGPGNVMSFSSVSTWNGGTKQFSRH
jgi:hypothetical protein